MKSFEFLKVVQQICYLLKLDQATIRKIIELYRIFSQSETHQFRSEIKTGACIFLACKMAEDQRSIRDITNMCFIVVSLYKLANKHLNNSQIEYVNMQFLKSYRTKDLQKAVVPDFTIEKVIPINSLATPTANTQLRCVLFNLWTIETSSYHHVFSQAYFNLIVPHKLSNLIIKIYNNSVIAEIRMDIPIYLCCIYLGIRIGLKSQLIKKEEIEEKLLQIQWWEKFMMIPKQTMIDFCINMLTFYKDE